MASEKDEMTKYIFIRIGDTKNVLRAAGARNEINEIKGASRQCRRATANFVLGGGGTKANETGAAKGIHEQYGMDKLVNAGTWIMSF